MTFLNYMKVLIEKIYSLVMDLLERKKKTIKEKRKQIKSTTSLKAIVSNQTEKAKLGRDESMEEYNINDPQENGSMEFEKGGTLEDLNQDPKLDRTLSNDFTLVQKDGSKEKNKLRSGSSNNIDKFNNLSNYRLTDGSDKKSKNSVKSNRKKKRKMKENRQKEQKNEELTNEEDN
jgi:hypothetical protein